MSVTQLVQPGQAATLISSVHNSAHKEMLVKLVIFTEMKSKRSHVVICAVFEDFQNQNAEDIEVRKGCPCWQVWP